jgi:N-formylglutamate amidohydrolase
MIRQLDTAIFHIPHTGTEIPDHTGYVISDDAIRNEIDRVTDWGVSEIFDFENVAIIRPSFSRLFCDVERFYDEKEPLSKVGYGITYTRTEQGGALRKLSESEKKYIIDTYYKPHHEALAKMTRQKIEKCGGAFILDCHSFPDEPLGWEQHSDVHRPDICIGTDEIHTPKEVVKFVTDYFSRCGYETALNYPFAGTIVPTEYYGDKRVRGMMIEINRRLYQDSHTQEIDTEMISRLHEQMRTCLEQASSVKQE